MPATTNTTSVVTPATCLALIDKDGLWALGFGLWATLALGFKASLLRPKPEPGSSLKPKAYLVSAFMRFSLL
jgi:hypothetical protein